MHRGSVCTIYSTCCVFGGCLEAVWRYICTLFGMSMHIVQCQKGCLNVNALMLRKAVDECAPPLLTNSVLIYAQKMDVILATCYERLRFCTPRCHQLWAILWPHFDPCYERQMQHLCIILSMLRMAALPGATKYWAILWPHTCLKTVLGRESPTMCKMGLK